jgi:rare lipoprotein A
MLKTLTLIAVALLGVTPHSAMADSCTQASYYGPGFHGGTTASGERFNQWALTTAHRYLPFGTRLRVTNRYNGRSVVVRVNDRGPFVGGRGLDLSTAAMNQIGGDGVASVCYSII